MDKHSDCFWDYCSLCHTHTQTHVSSCRYSVLVFSTGAIGAHPASKLIRPDPCHPQRHQLYRHQPASRDMMSLPPYDSTVHINTHSPPVPQIFGPTPSRLTESSEEDLSEHYWFLLLLSSSYMCSQEHETTPSQFEWGVCPLQSQTGSREEICQSFNERCFFSSFSSVPFPKVPSFPPFLLFLPRLSIC